jgi:murein DD-endopeptidase MepM/ murein hydrolase activator NlpD
MAYRHTPEVTFPLVDYRVTGRAFGTSVAGWGTHLGEDILASASTPVMSIGRGRVVYAAQHPGSSTKGNWGNIIITAHKHPRTRAVFYALYGHLGTLRKRKRDAVKMGEMIGTIGTAFTPENGWWDAHLHFAIYVGPWNGTVLPGYYTKEAGRTEMKYWKEPSVFIRGYRAK